MAADYTRAMLAAERRLTPGQLVALADAVRGAGVLNGPQLDALAALRTELVQLTSP